MGEFLNDFSAKKITLAEIETYITYIQGTSKAFKENKITPYMQSIFLNAFSDKKITLEEIETMTKAFKENNISEKMQGEFLYHFSNKKKPYTNTCKAFLMQEREEKKFRQIIFLQYYSV
jgi:hypothetical protein